MEISNYSFSFTIFMQLRATWRQKWPCRNNKSSGSAPSRRQPRRDARRCNIYHILLPKLELRGTVRLAWQPPLKNFKHALTHELSSSSRSLLGLFHQKYIVCWSETAKITSCVLEYSSSECLHLFMNLWLRLSCPNLMIAEYLPSATEYKS